MKKALLYSVSAVFALSLAACSNAAAEQAASGGEAANSAEVVKVGTEGTYAPFTYHDPKTNVLVGYDIDVAQAVAEELGIELQFEEVKWDGIFAGLDAKRYDVIANQVAVTPERQELYEFSEPYAVSTPVIIVREDDDSIKSVDDVAGKTSAQSVTSNWAELARGAGAEVVPVDGFTEAVAALRDGRVDATFNDNLAVLEYFATTGDDTVKVGVEVQDGKSHQAFAFRQDSELAPRFSEALEKVRDSGKLAEIGKKYFGADISQ